MKRDGAARRDAIAALVPQATLVVDVGADHGHVAAAVGAVAVERELHRAQRPELPWVIANGLAPFRSVPVAILAGMGARTILGILDRGPRPDVVIAHAPDEPDRLREGLAERGYRIDAEALAPEAGRYAEIVRAVPGEETATGLRLAYGPKLLASDDPALVPHLTHLRDVQAHLAAVRDAVDPQGAADARVRVAFLDAELARRTAGPSA